MDTNRYATIDSLSTLVSRVRLDICGGEDNLKHQNDILKDAIERVQAISDMLRDIDGSARAGEFVTMEGTEYVTCPECNHEFETDVFLGDYVKYEYCYDLEHLI